MEEAKGTIVFLGHLEKDVKPHQQSPWKCLGAVLTMAVKNACDGCPAVIMQHLQDVWIAETREGFGEFEG